jgi:hypothetical protein
VLRPAHMLRLSLRQTFSGFTQMAPRGHADGTGVAGRSGNGRAGKARAADDPIERATERRSRRYRDLSVLWDTKPT